MTKITYSNISIDTKALASYIADIQASKKVESYDSWRDRYSAGLAESIMYCLANDNVKFDTNDSNACALLELLIREIGYDSDGHYTEDAKKAFRILNKKRNINSDLFELQDIQIKTSPSQKIKAFVKDALTSIIKDIDPIKDLVSEFKGYLKKRIKIFILSGLGIIGGGSAYKFGPSVYHKLSSNKQAQEVKSPQKNQESRPSTIVLTKKDFVKVSDSVAKKAETKTDTLTRILAQKTAYKKALIARLSNNVTAEVTPKQTGKKQALVDSLERETYKSSLSFVMSSKEQNILSLQINKQLAKGMFKLEKGISKERLMHAVKMCQIYADYDKAGTKIVLDAINTKQKLTPAQQNAFTNYIINGVGERGVNLMEKSIEKGNKNNHRPAR